jgi:hypothetical protein
VGERRESEPKHVGEMRASELISFAPDLGVTTLGQVDDLYVVVSRALGRGQVIVSGALDAWKYRDESEGFDAYWRSLVWDAAAAAGPAVRVAADRSLVGPGERVRIQIEQQSLREPAVQLAAEGRYDCDSERGVLRVWPEPRPGTFSSEFYPRSARQCRIDVAIDGVSGTTSIAIRDDVRVAAAAGDRLASAVAAYGGTVVRHGDEGQLLSRVRQLPPERFERRDAYPMRPPWWFVPFTACLAGEWLLRRRAGLS